MRWLVPALLVSLALACGEGPAPAGPSTAGSSPAREGSAPNGTPLEARSEAGGFVARIAPLGGEVPMNAPFGVEVRLFDAAGEAPLVPEEVTLDARMPEHEHGMLRDVVLEPVAPGVWRAEGLLFHMVGLWQFHVDVRTGPRIERAALDLVLR